MSAQSVRPRFREGRFLGFGDLLAERAQREGAARRHHIGLHRWGVVAGLRLLSRPKGFEVSSGYAVDGLGRGLVVEAPIEVDIDPVVESTWHVWLTFVDGSAGGDCTRGPHSAICLTPAATVDPRFPPGADDAAADLPPHAVESDTDGSWPIYLGSVTWNGTTVVADGDRRPFVGLAGESVAAPSGRARLQIGAESAANPVRFAIVTESVPPADAGEPPVLPPPAPRLTIDAQGNVSVLATSSWRGDVRVGPAPGLPSRAHAGLAFRAVADPAAPSPWTIYRTKVERDGREIDQLRVEIGHPRDDGDPTRHRFVVGAVGAAGFRPCLSVDADCTVTVHENLDVRGLLVEGPVPPDPSDPRFTTAVVDRFHQGFAGGAAMVAVTVSSDSHPTEGAQFKYQVVVSAGPTDLLSTQVHVVVGIGDQQEEATKVLDNETLAASSVRTIDRVFAVPAGRPGELIVSAMALAISPAGNIVSGRGELTATIRPQIT